jgi:ferritin-like metal-binding protein YciE
VTLAVIDKRHLPPTDEAMGLLTKDIKTLEDLFSHGLKDIYYAENQILKALPKLIDSTTNPQLKKGLKDHLEETKEQVSQLEQIFEMREEKPKGTKCPGINGLIQEGEGLTGNIADKKVVDAAIIASAQAVEHYEMTRYGALIAWAQELGRNDFADILGVNLEEEKAADAKLNALAERRVNAVAQGRRPVRKPRAVGRKKPQPKAA